MAADGASENALERVDLIFDVLQRQGYLTLAEIVKETGIPRSSAHRLLTRMVRMRWLLRVGTSYELGVRLFTLGTEGIRNHWFHKIAYPRLRELHTRTGYVVHLAYLDGTDIVIWDKIGGGAFGIAVPTRIGSRIPAHQCALGKVLLASESDEFVQGISELPAATQRTVTDLDKLREELETVRERRYAIELAENVSGVGCIATLVQAGVADTSDGRTTTAAISICGPVSRIGKEFLPPLLEMAASITRAVGPNPMVDHRGANS